MVPLENHGVKCMSMGFLVDKDAPIVWRGPMVCLQHVLFIFIAICNLDSSICIYIVEYTGIIERVEVHLGA